MNHESMQSSEFQEVPYGYRRNETNLETIAAIERAEMVQNPENVGLNLTSDEFIDPRHLRELAKIQDTIKKEGEEVAFQKVAAEYELTEEQARGLYDFTTNNEMSKLDKMRNSLGGLPDGVSFRVNPFPPHSPFSMEYCLHSEEDVQFFSFDAVALEQLHAIYDKVNAGDNPGDLTVVMSPYTAERGGNMPETDEEIAAYSEMCIKFLEQMEFPLDESGICLELGNETNVDRSTKNYDGSLMFTKEDVCEKSDPIKYAEMYKTVAKAIKDKYPNVKVAIAGTAMFDDKYLATVMSKIGDANLVDKISFHPYRSTVEEGAPTFRDGVCTSSALSYEQQIQRMSDMAEVAGASFDVGEVSFSSAYGQSVDMVELHRNSADAKARGIKSYTWPERQILQK